MPQAYFSTTGVSASVPADGTQTVKVKVPTICGSEVDVPPAPSLKEATDSGVGLPGYGVGFAPPERAAFIRAAVDLARQGRLYGGNLISDAEYLQTVVEVGAGWKPAAEAAGKTFTKEDLVRHIEKRVTASGGKQSRADVDRLAGAVFSGVEITSKETANYEKPMVKAYGTGDAKQIRDGFQMAWGKSYTHVPDCLRGYDM